MADENTNLGAGMAAENKLESNQAQAQCSEASESTTARTAEDYRNKAEQSWDETKASAGQVSDYFHRTAYRVKDTVTATAQQVADRVKEQAKQTGDKLKEQSRGFLNEQKARVGAEIHTYSTAAHRAAEQLKDESDNNLARYVATAADRLDRLGSRIQERDLG